MPESPEQHFNPKDNEEPGNLEETVDPEIQEQEREEHTETLQTLSGAASRLEKSLHGMQELMRGKLPSDEAMAEADAELNEQLDSESELGLVLGKCHLLSSMTEHAKAQIVRAPESDHERILQEAFAMYKEFLRQFGIALEAMTTRIERFDDYMQNQHFEESIQDFFNVVSKFVDRTNDGTFEPNIRHKFNTEKQILNLERSAELTQILDKLFTDQRWDPNWDKPGEHSIFWHTIPGVKMKMVFKLRQFANKIEDLDKYSHLAVRLTQEQKDEAYEKYIDPLCKKLGIQRADLFIDFREFNSKVRQPKKLNEEE